MVPHDSILSRRRILDAATRIYEESGFRGATTRRIADAAGVNEITIFRQFGSKAALMEEVLRCSAALRSLATLPEIPTDPVRELTNWSQNYMAHLIEARPMIRRMMAEVAERADVAPCVSTFPLRASAELQAYVARLCVAGFVGADVDPRSISAMLMGSLFGDAMGRDIMPEMFPPEEDAPAAYTRLALHAAGCRHATADTAARRGAHLSLTRKDR